MPGRFSIGRNQVGMGADLLVIAGPCVLESLDSSLAVARFVQDTLAPLNLGFVFKASYDKANRTSHKSYRGPGLKTGLTMLAEIKQQTGATIMSDVHEVDQVEAAAEVLDVIQIPAFLCRQTDLVQTVARTGKVVNIKKGQFLSPWDIRHAIDKILAVGNNRIMITERGTSFGYQNLVVDMRGLPIMRSYGFPVVFDATHSVQLPGGGQASSSGDRSFIAPLARAAVAAGVDGVFMEVHPDPDCAKCDGPNSLPLDQFPALINNLAQIHRLVLPMVNHCLDERSELRPFQLHGGELGRPAKESIDND